VLADLSVSNETLLTVLLVLAILALGLLLIRRF
jgi:hypothetical protein